MESSQTPSLRRSIRGPARRKSKPTGNSPNLTPRSLQLEPFEERLLFAIGPELVAVFQDPATVLTPNQTVRNAPGELTFRFDKPIDPNSLLSDPSAPGIQLHRAGPDNALNTSDDVLVVPSYMAIGDRPEDVIVRFAQTSLRSPYTLPDGTPLPDSPAYDPTLPDDSYRILIVGAGSNPLMGTNGFVFNNALDLTQDFTLDLAPQVVAIVPQPISRGAGGALTQATNQVDVYFNANDPLGSSVLTKTFYELIRTTDASDQPVSQSIVNPTGVSYDASTGKAVLTFAAGVLSTPGIYRLRIGNNEPLPLATTDLGSGFAGSSLDTARNLGTQFPVLQGSQSVKVDGYISGSPVNVIYPGGNNEPGTRTINSESHLWETTDTSGAVPVYSYNFQQIIGQVQGADAYNLITEPQKQRVREALSYYSNYLGVSFVETANAGFTFATGDGRVIDPNNTHGGVHVGFNKAVISSATDWGNAEPGGFYFRTAMTGVGFLLGLSFTGDLPPLAMQGSHGPLGDSPAAEPVFPGDSDILLGQYLHPPVGNDIQIYRFALPRAGQLNLETIAERLANLNSFSQPLDSVITLFDSAGRLVARNDDYYGKDSFLQLQLASGTYYAAVTSTGNTAFDPTITGSGFGGTTQGRYELKLTFTPTVTSGIRDASGTLLDGDNDGSAGGAHNFWFRTADSAHTFFVDKAATGGTGALGSITNPYTDIASALAVATPGSVVRIVGNGGTDNDLATVANNRSYNIGFDNIGNALSDGSKFEIPQGVTVMIDAGAIIKLRAANIDVGSSAQGVDRSDGALQVLGTVTGIRNDADDDLLRGDTGSVYFTSYYASDVGADSGTAKDSAPLPGNWGGLVFRNDPSLRVAGDTDLEASGIFLNTVNHANISYGGGKVVVNSIEQAFTPIHLVTSRPTVAFNAITRSADAAVSADPNSFQESEFQGPAFDYDYTRSGPKVYGNALADNSINGLFLRIRTDAGESLDPLTVSARFSTTDMTYVINENLVVAGAPGGGIVDENLVFHARPSARLAIDPGVIVKLGGARIETQIGAQFIAEGTAARPIIFTSTFDDRYGSGGSFDATNDNKAGATHTAPAEGNWGGLFFGPLSIASLDHVLVTFAGGATTVEGGFATFNAVEIHQAQARIANSTFEHNAAGPADNGDDRAGRTWSAPAVIFVRGAQPVIIDNIIQNNDTAPVTDPNAPFKNTAAISINVNALNARQVTDWGRSTGPANIQVSSVTNTGPLIRGNRIGNTPINGLIVRGGTITTNSIWDDTDIVHVVQDEIIAGNQFSVLGTIRLQSSSTESLVVKFEGATAGLTASGTPLDIHDRIGGTVQVVGLPNHPVIMTSAFDDSVGAGFKPNGQAQNDTHNLVVEEGGEPPLSTNSGPIFLDGGDRDDHGFRNDDGNQAGWKFIEQALNYANTGSLNADGSGILAIGVQVNEDTATRAESAIRNAANALGLSVTFATGGQITNADFSEFKVIYVPSDEFNTQGGISDADLALLTARKFDIQNYINEVGGGLVALSEDFAAQPYSWLELPAAFTIAHTGGVELTQTPLLAAAGFNITDEELTAGTPWHNSFVGPPGFNRLQPWVVDPNTGAVVTLGLGPGSGGIGPRAGNAQPGDWRSVKLDVFSNDTNVDLVTEIEQGFAPTGDTNSVPTTAQFLGVLAKDLKSGDDNQRLGFEIHGSISQSVAQPKFGDVDVFSFKGTAGTAVWFDIDRTSSALDTVVELIDANGGVVARSDNSLTEAGNPALLTGIAKPLRIGFAGSAGPFTSPDFYSTNPLDAGMRLDLPGTVGTVNTYFVRVRADSSDLTRLNGGLTKGSYQLQIRLQDLDVFPGSVVRHADIRYAGTGIEVIGKPEHSPLLGDTAETSNVHNTLATAQDIGNLLTTDANHISLAGGLAAAGEVDWFKLELDYDQAIGNVIYSETGERVFPAMFQVNYADGISRPDTTISVFDQDGNLVYIGRDSDNPDSLPRSSMGSDAANQSHGSFGVLDPTIGTVELRAGSTTGSKLIYYVAVSANNTLPTILNASFQMNPTNPQVRLQPLNSVTRIFDDSIGGNPARRAFPGTTPAELNAASTPLQLGDIVAFVNTGSDLLTINPFTGQVQTFITSPSRDSAPDNLPNTLSRFYSDIAMRNDGRLVTIPTGDNTNVNSTFLQLNASNGTQLTTTQGGLSGQFAIGVFDVDPDDAITEADPADPESRATYNFVEAEDDFGIAVNGMTYGNNIFGSFNAVDVGGRVLYVVGNRTGGNGTIRDTQNLLFRLNPNTGAPFSFDTESNTTYHSGEAAFQPFPDTPSDPHPEGPGSGTSVIPRGVLTTGTFLIAQAATDPVSATTGGFTFNDIVDGATFQVGEPTGDAFGRVFGKTFEFETSRQLSLNQSDTLNGIASLRNAQTFTVDALTFQLVSGPVLNAVGSGAGLTGQTFSIMDSNGVTVVFEFGAPGSVAPGRVAVPTAATTVEVAANVVTAINVTAHAQFPAFVGQAARPSDTSTRVTLTGDFSNDAAVTGSAGLVREGIWNLPGLGTTNTPVFFEETDAFAAFGANLSSVVTTTSGAAVNASFARDRITFRGATSANFTSFTTASADFGSSGASGVVLGNVVIPVDAADTAAEVAQAIAAAINGAGIDIHPFPGNETSLARPKVTATIQGTDVIKINGSQLTGQSSNFSLATDGNTLFLGSFQPTIEGIAFLPSSGDFGDFTSDDDLYAVSSGGAIYRVTNAADDYGAQLNLLNVVEDDFGRPVYFTGLSAGPPNVEGGRYARTLFATDLFGTIWAFDDQGQPAPIFLDGATKVNVTETGTSFGFGFNTFFGNLQGIAFSTLDYNPWHATTTHGSDPAGDAGGNTSFYFGLEAGNVATIGNPNVLPSAYWQPGATNYTPFVDSLNGGNFLDTGNIALSNSYNLPGGALGSLTTARFDLSAYTATDKPTLYFDYSADTENVDALGATMKDSFRVFASSDGANWLPLATSNSIRSTSSELPPIASVNGGTYQNDRTNQRVQELFDPTGLPAPEGSVPGAATRVVNWRQARVDLGDFAGKSDVQIRFDFSTAGSMGIGALKQGGVYLAGVAGSKLQDGLSFTIDNSLQTGFDTSIGPIYTTTYHAFVFRSGAVLQAPAGGGKVIPGGETLIVDGTVFELTKTGVVSGANIPVLIHDGMTAEDVAQAIVNTMTVTPVAGVTPLRVADLVQLQGASTVTQGGSPRLILRSGTLPASLGRTDIPYTIDMTDEQIAVEVAKALDREFSFVNGNTDDLSNFTSSKVVGRTIRLYGHNVISPGPLPYSNTLPGDQNGKFYSPVVWDVGAGTFVYYDIDAAADRGENNAHEGVFIDNLIVGFAGRGEQVINTTTTVPGPTPDDPPITVTAVSTFDTLPVDPTGGVRITTGPYQLSIRRGTEYVPGALIDGNPLVFSPGQTFDINDRLAQGLTLYAVPASQIADGSTFSIVVEVGTFTFEFDSDGSWNPANYRVPISTNYDAQDVALMIRNAINGVPSNTNFGVKAGLNNATAVYGQTSFAVNLFGAVDVQAGPLGQRVFGEDNNSNFGFGFFNFALPVLGDASPVRPQGQTILHGNRVSDALSAGIVVTPELVYDPFTGLPVIGTPGHTSSVANLSTLNPARLVPGISIKDNLVVAGGTTGILFSGSPNNDIAHAVPFGRIVNNTVALTPTGIRVANNASPTILNNIVAETKTGISVDDTSTTTIVGANIYQSNTTNLEGVGQTNAIVLQPTDPLFVDTSKRNYYLRQNSLAIDSSVNSLQERPAMQAVTSPLGIPASPILAPDFDLLGQLRVDDPAVASPSGLGSNVFKDRGALERSDALGPLASLFNPVDNDPAGADRSATINKVVLVGRQLSEFNIQLNDAGQGVDDTTVDATKFTLQKKVGSNLPVTLVADLDYTINYDNTNKIVRIVPIQGIWTYATYTITLANGSSAQPIRDLAGHALQPNEASGLTQFVIQESETAVSPWQNPVNRFDVNNNGSVSGLDALLVINRLLLPGGIGTIPPSTPIPPYIDVDGNGSLTPSDALAVINYLTTTPPAAPLVQSLVTTEVTAAPSAATAAPSTAIAAPMAAATDAEAAQDANPLVAGLAISQMADSQDDSAAAIVDGSSGIVTQQAAAAAQSDVSITDAALAATFESEAFDEEDSELDGILSDLTEDALQLAS